MISLASIIWGVNQQPLNVNTPFFNQQIKLSDVVQAIAGVATSIGVLIALFDVRSTQFLNKVKARGVIVPFTMQRLEKNIGLRLSRIFNNGFWSFPVFDISHANRKARFPIFYIKNISGEGFATNVQIELCSGTRGE